MRVKLAVGDRVSISTERERLGGVGVVVEIKNVHQVLVDVRGTGKSRDGVQVFGRWRKPGLGWARDNSIAQASNGLRAIPFEEKVVVAEDDVNRL